MRLLQTWCERNVLTINESKSNYMIFNSKRTQQTINIHINGIPLTRVTETNYLGLNITDELRWNRHISNIIDKNSKTIAAIRKIKSYIPRNLRVNIYNSLFVAHVNYLINIQGNTTNDNIQKLQRQQNKILKTLHEMPYRTPTTKVLETTNEITIHQRIALNNTLALQNQHRTNKNKDDNCKVQ